MTEQVTSIDTAIFGAQCLEIKVFIKKSIDQWRIQKPPVPLSWHYKGMKLVIKTREKNRAMLLPEAVYNTVLQEYLDNEDYESAGTLKVVYETLNELK